MQMNANGELVSVIEDVFVTPGLLVQYNASHVKLTVQILQSDYEQCRRELLSLPTEEKTIELGTDVTSSCYTSDQDGEYFFAYPYPRLQILLLKFQGILTPLQELDINVTVGSCFIAWVCWPM